MLSNSQTSHSTSDAAKQSRALTGQITKLLDNFGFIDDSVFFQLSVVKGGDVQVGDKVYCECSYSEHLPFKWNATKVHLVQTNSRTANTAAATAPAQQSHSTTPSNASQVATTYLQHRLQQQQQQQQQSNRDESNNSAIGGAMSGALGGNNYYASSNQMSRSSDAFPPQYDFSKTQQAVAAAQQLAQYYGARNETQSNSFSQLQYTSTPGSAFVSSSLPFTQQIQANLLSSQTRNTPQNSYKTSGSRWEREDRQSGSRNSDFRNRDNDRNRFGDSFRKRHDDRDVAEGGGGGGRGRDEFGRDLRRDREKEQREARPERQRPEVERERRLKRSESPNSSVASSQAAAQPRTVQRRRYEPVNIPKLAILKNPLNVYDIKQRYSSNLHVPSDLKEVVVNSQFSLNISQIPKPITFRVIDSKNDNNNHIKKKDSPKKSDKDISKKNEDKDDNQTDQMEVDDNKDKTASLEHPKQIHKYGVKVLIISLPSMNDIYDRIFGSDFDAISSGSKAYFLHFNKLLAFLVSRNANDGFSLIGGKFNAQLDGYLCESEEPDLIATAVRVVREQTGMNLSKCVKWKLIATFVYSRDNSVDSMNPSLEFTRVYMPDIWTALDTIYEELNEQKNKKIINDLENNNEFESVLNNNDLIEKNDIILTNDDKSPLINEQPLIDSSDSLVAPPQPQDSTSCPSESTAATAAALDSTSNVAVEPSEQSIDCQQFLISNNTSSASEIDSKSETALDSQVVDMSANVDNSSPSVAPPETTSQEENHCSPTPSTKLDSEQPEENNCNTSAPSPTAAIEAKEEQSSGDTPPVNPSSGLPTPPNSSKLQALLSRINDMKVAELRAELEKRGARIKAGLKKADLVQKLRQILNELMEDEDVVSDEVKNDWWAQRILSQDQIGSGQETDQSSEGLNHTEEQSTDAQPISDELSKTASENTSLNNESNADDSALDNKADESECVTLDNESNNESQMIVDLSRDEEKEQVVTVDDNAMEAQESESAKEESQKSPVNETTKRKSDNESPEIETKKAKNCIDSQEVIPKKVTDGCVYVKGGENLTVITLHEALNHQRYDQFEMSIVSELIRESLIHHFSHYLLSTLVHNQQQIVVKDNKTEIKTSPLQVNYVHLSFAYFDSSHCGHVLSEDLAKLLNNANFTLSRRAFNLLVKNEEKVVYRDLIDPKDLLDIKKISHQSYNKSDSSKTIERNGTVYDIEKLIQQSEKDDKIKVKLSEELTENKEKIDQLNEYIVELENRQKKMTTATEKQNDEICSLKREREIIKNKFESMRKAVENSVLSFNEVLKNEDKN